MMKDIKDYVPVHRVEELITDIYYLKMELEQPLKKYSNVEIHDMAEMRMDKRKELDRLLKLKDRKKKIDKIKSKI